MLFLFFLTGCRDILSAPGRSRWACPNDHSIPALSAPGSQGLNFLFSAESNWRSVLSSVDVFQFYLASLFDDLHTDQGFDFKRVNDDETIRKAVRILNEHKIAIAVEGGALFGFDAGGDFEGETAAQLELVFMNRIYEAGGTVSFLSMDDPIDRLHNPCRKMLRTICGFDLETAIREIVDYMKTIHAQRPEIKIGMIFNFAARIYGGVSGYPGFEGNDIDYKTALVELVKAVDKAGEKLYFVHADSPFDFTTGIVQTDAWRSISSSDAINYPSKIDWTARILELERQVESYGLAFGLIYSSQRGGEETSGSDRLFHDDVLAYLSLYAKRGGSPKNYIIQSWYKRPCALGPETRPYSFTYLLNEIFNLILRSTRLKENERMRSK